MESDVDPQETQEWLDALVGVLENEGVERAHFLIEQLIDKARRSGAHLPDLVSSGKNFLPAILA